MRHINEKITAKMTTECRMLLFDNITGQIADGFRTHLDINATQVFDVVEAIRSTERNRSWEWYMQDKSRWIRQKVFRHIFKKFHAMSKGLDANIVNNGPRNLAVNVTSIVRQIEQTSRNEPTNRSYTNILK